MANTYNTGMTKMGTCISLNSKKISESIINQYVK